MAVKRDGFCRKFLMLASACGLGVFALPGATCVWTGGSGAWSDSANWLDGAVPSAGDTVYVSNTVANVTIEIDADAAPLEKTIVAVPEPAAVDGNLSVIVTALDKKTGRIVSEEQIVIRQNVPSAEGDMPLPETCSFSNGHFALTLPDGQIMRSNSEYTLLYRAPTDNDTDLQFHNMMEPFMDQVETVISSSPILNGYRVETELTNKKGPPDLAKHSASRTFLTSLNTPAEPVKATAI